MTLRELAWKNLRYRLRSLFGFVFAVAFGAWLFFLFASLQRDPALRNEMGRASAALGTIQFMVIGIAVVTALYALGALLRGRGRELGLLQLQGMGHRHLGRLLAWETLILGIGATLLGILIGVLTGKLWYLGFSRAFALAEPLHFTIQPVALLQTLLLFGLLFGLSGLWSAWRLGRQPVGQLLQAESRRDGALRVSWWQVALCALSYGVAGYLVLGDAGAAGEQLTLLVVSLAVGTYLLYLQGGVALLAWIRQRPFYWRGTNPILLAGLGHRLRSNAWLLWLVTALAALTITMTGLITGLLLEMREGAQGGQAVDILLMENRQIPLALSPERVRSALREAEIEVMAETTITVGREVTATGMGEAILLSRSDWERWRLVQPDLPVLPEKGLFVVVEPRWFTAVPDGPAPPRLMERLPVALRNESALVQHGSVVYGRLGPGITVVLPDLQFAAMQDSLRLEPLTGWRQTDWFSQARAISEVVKTLGPEQQVDRLLLSRGGHYWRNRQGFGLLFFLFAFTGLLFFLSSGAILAFRLFMAVQADRQRFLRLNQIGLSPREMTRLIWREAAVLFLTPLFLAALYSSGAILLIGRLSKTELWPGGLVALGVYAVLQLLYLRLSTVAYRRAVSQA